MATEWDLPPVADGIACDRCGHPNQFTCGCIQVGDVVRGVLVPLPPTGDGWSEIAHHHDSPQCEYCGAWWLDCTDGTRVMDHDDDCLFILVEEIFTPRG